MLEIIAATVGDARIAERAGADRIELVSALSEGGLTPGFGLMKQVVAAVRIPVNVMIRPHGRGFIYDADDLEVMKEEIRAARMAGANGVVMGVLTDEGTVDAANLSLLLSVAGGLEVTFHRAIDDARDPVAAIRMLSGFPSIHSVLTSGGRGSIEEHLEVLEKMRANAGHVRIMAGGGLTLENTERIARGTSIQDFHYGTAVRHGRNANGAIDPERVALLKRLLCR